MPLEATARKSPYIRPGMSLIINVAPLPSRTQTSLVQIMMVTCFDMLAPQAAASWEVAVRNVMRVNTYRTAALQTSDQWSVRSVMIFA